MRRLSGATLSEQRVDHRPGEQIAATSLHRAAADCVDRILRGAKAGDRPVQVPNKIDLTINLKAAKALGIAIPQSVLLQASEVIR